MKLFTQFPHPMLTVNSFECVIIYHFQHSKNQWQGSQFKMVTYKYREYDESSHRLITLTAAYGPYSPEKNPKNCLSHSHTSGRGAKPMEVGGRAGHRLTNTPHSDLDLENIWRPAFCLGWKLQAAMFSPFFSSLVGVTLTSPLPCCSLRLLPDRSHVSGLLVFAAGTQGLPLNLWLWGLNWWPHKTVYICVFSKLLPGEV